MGTDKGHTVIGFICTATWKHEVNPPPVKASLALEDEVVAMVFLFLVVALLVLFRST